MAKTQANIRLCNHVQNVKHRRQQFVLIVKNGYALGRSAKRRQRGVLTHGIESGGFRKVGNMISRIPGWHPYDPGAKTNLRLHGKRI